MEKMISDELTKYLIVLGGTAVALYIIVTKLITKIKGAYKPFKKQTIYYLIFAVLVFALLTVIAYPSVIAKPFTAFIIFQISFLLLGTAHAYYIRSSIKWATGSDAFVPSLLFTLLVAIFGCIGFLLAYRFLMNKNGLEFIMATSIMFFIIPFFFYHTFLKAISIPPKIMKEWFYPLKQEVDDPDESKLKNLLVISFEFKKKYGDQAITNFRAKAPVDMDFGELFYYFINDYNERHPDSKVEFVNGTGEPNGWIFYKKQKWHTIKTNYIDADKTVFNNHIQENDIIICSRSLI
ncbi:MAG: TssN family type VI secretion system protein [Agriterribacter sp.]